MALSWVSSVVKKGLLLLLPASAVFSVATMSGVVVSSGVVIMSSVWCEEGE